MIIVKIKDYFFKVRQTNFIKMHLHILKSGRLNFL